MHTFKVLFKSTLFSQTSVSYPVSILTPLCNYGKEGETRGIADNLFPDDSLLPGADRRHQGDSPGSFPGRTDWGRRRQTLWKGHRSVTGPYGPTFPMEQKSQHLREGQWKLPCKPLVTSHCNWNQVTETDSLLLVKGGGVNGGSRMAAAVVTG